MKKKKLIVATTIPASLNFFKGNLRYLSMWFDICAVSSQPDKLVAVGIREGIRVYSIPMLRAISFWHDLKCLIAFIRFFHKERPDFVHGNTPKASLLSMLAAKFTQVPVRVYMCHGLRYLGARGGMRFLLKCMEKLSCCCATEVICVSRGVRNTLVNDKICPLSKAVVIGHGSANGVDMEWFNPESVPSAVKIRKDLGIGEDEFIFVFVGRLVRDKGVNEMVSAFIRLAHKKVHLLLVGPEEGRLNPITEETRTHIKNNSRIHALGKQQDVRPFILAADALVLPSYREGFGMVLIEAGSLGKPCLSSDIIGCNEIIIPGVNGELVPAKDENALYLKMKDWVEHPEKVKRMAANARRLVAERYEQKQVWQALLKEYKRLTGDL